MDLRKDGDTKSNVDESNLDRLENEGGIGATFWSSWFKPTRRPQGVEPGDLTTAAQFLKARSESRRR
jgi:hypothetical protein